MQFLMQPEADWSSAITADKVMVEKKLINLTLGLNLDVIECLLRTKVNVYIFASKSRKSFH